jgi:PadR family transcriptional regulator, regulatory protein PadR
VVRRDEQSDSPDLGAFEMGNWQTQLRKGLLELCILTVLGRGEVYGYDLVKRLAEIPGLVVTEGTVYPLLSRLRKARLVESRLEESAGGPARKYYAVSEEGRRVLKLMNLYWGELIEGVEGLLSLPGRARAR